MTDPADGPRLPLRLPAELEPDQRELHERIVGGPRGQVQASVPIATPEGALLGPFAVMVVAPGVGDAVQQLGAALRFTGELDALTREAAILLVAAHRRSEFEWFAHERAARDAGLGDAQLEAIRSGRVPDGLPPGVVAALTVVNVLLSRGALDDGEYRSARDSLGERRLAELVWLTGYYGMLALALATFAPPNPLAPETVFPD